MEIISKERLKEKNVRERKDTSLPYFSIKNSVPLSKQNNYSFVNSDAHKKTPSIYLNTVSS